MVDTRYENLDARIRSYRLTLIYRYLKKETNVVTRLRTGKTKRNNNNNKNR